MKSFINSVALAVLLSIGSTHAAQINYTSPVTSTGNTFTILDPGGSLIGGTNDVVFDWDGTLNTSVAGAVSNATLTSDEAFFGALWSAHDVTEPPRVSRQLVGLSQAAMADPSRWR